jgi:hypothetical protein
MSRDMEFSFEKCGEVYEKNTVAADVQRRCERPSSRARGSNSRDQHAFNGSDDVSTTSRRGPHFKVTRD